MALTPEDYFGAGSVGLETFERVRAALTLGGCDGTRVEEPGRVPATAGVRLPVDLRSVLRRSVAPVVLSIATRRRLRSERFKEVVHPDPWMHHLEVLDAADVDDEVVSWLSTAAEQAGLPAESGGG